MNHRTLLVTRDYLILSHFHKTLMDIRLRRVLSGGQAHHELRNLIEKSAAFCGPHAPSCRIFPPTLAKGCATFRVPLALSRHPARVANSSVSACAASASPCPRCFLVLRDRARRSAELRSVGLSNYLSVCLHSASYYFFQMSNFTVRNGLCNYSVNF